MKAILLILLLATSALGQTVVNVDASTDGVTTSPETSDSFTVSSGSDQVLIDLILGQDSLCNSITGVTWNGGAEAFTDANIEAAQDFTCAQTWYLVDPGAATSTVLATNSGTSHESQWLILLSGVDTSDVFGATDTAVANETTGTSLSGLSLTTTVGKFIVACAFADDTPGAITADQGTEFEPSLVVGVSRRGLCVYLTAASTTETVTFSWENTNARDVAAIMFEVNAAAITIAPKAMSLMGGR